MSERDRRPERLLEGSGAAVARTAKPPKQVERCPSCGQADSAETLPSPVVRAFDAKGEIAYRIEDVRRRETLWFYCAGCSLVYDGTENEWEAYREEREGLRPAPDTRTPQEKYPWAFGRSLPVEPPLEEQRPGDQHDQAHQDPEHAAEELAEEGGGTDAHSPPIR